MRYPDNTNKTVTMPKRIQEYGTSKVIRISEECKMLGLGENDLVDISIKVASVKNPITSVKAVQHYGPSKIIRVSDLCGDDMDVGSIVTVTFSKHGGKQEQAESPVEG